MNPNLTGRPEGWPDRSVNSAELDVWCTKHSELVVKPFGASTSHDPGTILVCLAIRLPLQ